MPTLGGAEPNAVLCKTSSVLMHVLERREYITPAWGPVGSNCCIGLWSVLFYWRRKLKYPEKATELLHATENLYLIKLYRVHIDLGRVRICVRKKQLAAAHMSHALSFMTRYMVKYSEQSIISSFI